MSSYNNFKTAIYCTAQSMESISRENLQKQIEFFQTYVGVDKVYLELYRDDTLVSEQQYEMCKKTFEENGITVSGALTTTISDISEEDSKRQRLCGTYCFSNEPMRNRLKETVKYIASKFDEFIIDDFYFTQCMCEDCIREKGDKSWEEFRTEKMLEVSRNLVVGPAKEINPDIRVIIKYPNWRESYQETGYCPGEQKDVFDMLYTGTETRHTVYTDQHLPRYMSYSIMRFMENTWPGHNGGGWFDPYQCFPVDTYLEQAYLTAFSKPRELMMFCWGSLYKNKLATPLRLQFSTLDALLSQVGNCVGLPVYLPHRSQGEDHLEDYLGMAGIPFEPVPYFPKEAESVFLTVAAHKDPDIVKKLESYVKDGGKAIVTSAFMIQALGKGIEQMTSIRYNGRRFTAEQYGVTRNAEFGMDYVKGKKPVTFPVMEHRNNASWSLLNSTKGDFSSSLLLRDTYGKGQLICLVVPDCYSDIKDMPGEVLTRIRYECGNSMYIEAPSGCSLFIYDNDTFAVYPYIMDGCKPERIRVHVRGDAEELIPLDSSVARMMEAFGIQMTPLFKTKKETVFEIHVTPGEFLFCRIVRSEKEAEKEHGLRRPMSAPHVFTD